MEKINVKVNQTTREVGLTRQIVGNQLENLQDELVFSFTDKFVDGQARLEYEIDNTKYWVTLDKVNETYTLPLNSQITSQEEVFMQLVISVDNGTFKSNVFSLYFANSINAETEAPEQYPTWLDKANEKLNQMDNINITANKVDNVATITVTRKDKTQDSVKIEDGAKGDKGDKGDIGLTGNGISKIEKVDSVGLKTNYKINFTDGTNFNYSVNDGKTPVKGTDYYTEQDKQEMVNGIVTDVNNNFNVNVTSKTNEFNSNVVEKTNKFNSNASSKVGEYNTNAKKELGSYNDNATTKLKAYNDNHTAKLEEYNNNSIVKVGNYNDNADKQVADFNTNVITKTSEYNENATTKYNAYNTNDETKLKEYNDNATAKLAEFNLTASSKLNFKEYAVLGDRVSNEEANDIISKKEEYKDTIIYFKQGKENIGYGFVTYYGQNLLVVFYNTGEITSNNGYYERTITYSRSQIYDKLEEKLSTKQFELKGNELTQEEATKVIEFAEEPDYYGEYHNALLSFVNTNYDEVAKGFVVTGNEELLYTFDKNGLTKWTKTTKEVLSSKEIANNTKRIKTLETNIFDSGVASGEFINIKDSALAEFQEIKSSINKAQETTKGYQLFNIIKIVPSNTNATLENKIIKINGKLAKPGNVIIYGNAKFKANKTYSIKLICKGEVIKSSYRTIYFKATGEERATDIGSLSSNYDVLYIYKPKIDSEFQLINIDLGTNVEFKNYEISLVFYEGEDNKIYEKYTGGIASPNPDYPQKINTIKENWNTISTGKNLLNIESWFNSLNVPYTKEENKYTLNWNGNLYSKPYMFSKEDRIVKLSANQITNITSKGFRIGLTDITGRTVKWLESGTNVSEVASGIRFDIGSVGEFSFNELMVTIGKVLLPYEPYQSISTPNDLKGNEFLPGDNIIKKFNVEDGKYWVYLEKNMGKIAFDGNEGWTEVDWNGDIETKNYVTYLSKKAYIYDYNCPNCYSNKYVKSNFVWANKKKGVFGIDSDSGVHFRTDKINSYSEWIAKLKEWNNVGEPLEVVYELAEKYKQLIPIAPLDQMNMTYNPETNLFSSIRNIKIEAKYYREFATTIRNMQIDNGKLQEQLNDMEKRIVALENRPVVVNEPVEEVANA